MNKWQEVYSELRHLLWELNQKDHIGSKPLIVVITVVIMLVEDKINAKTE